MKQCIHCGEMLNNDVAICTKCGALADNYVSNETYLNVYHAKRGKRIKNRKLVFWFLLGLFLPYIGFLVSWFMYDSERDRSRTILLGCIVSTIISTLLGYILPLITKTPEDNNSENSGKQLKLMIDLYKNI